MAVDWAEPEPVVEEEILSKVKKCLFSFRLFGEWENKSSADKMIHRFINTLNGAFLSY